MWKTPKQLGKKYQEILSISIAVCRSAKLQRKWSLPVLHLLPKTKLPDWHCNLHRGHEWLSTENRSDPWNALRLFLALVGLSAKGSMVGKTQFQTTIRKKPPSARNKPHRYKSSPWRRNITTCQRQESSNWQWWPWAKYLPVYLAATNSLRTAWKPHKLLKAD